MKQCLLEGRVDLVAQAPDGDLHHVGVAVEIHVPHLLGNLGARQYLAVPSQEQCQKQELLGGQLQLLTAAERLAPHQVHVEIGKAQLRGLCRIPCAMRAPQEHLDACVQFGKREGLNQIVVSTCLQSQHAVLDAHPRCQHQNGCLPGFAKSGEEAETVDPWEHRVQHQQVVPAFEGHV